MSTKTIRFGQGGNLISGILSPLITFDCIFDTDFGLMKLISREYFDTEVFSVDFFNKDNSIIRNMISSLYNRDDINPIKLCIRDDKADLADQLYKDFMKEKYNEIVQFAMPTEIYNALGLFELSGDIKPTILYQTKEEYDLLNEFDNTKMLSKISINELSDLSLHNQFFFKNIDDYYTDILSANVKGSSIYIASYPFNLESGTIRINKNTTMLSLNRNEIFTFDIYDKNKLQNKEHS